jgi:branched-chain amino acid transport system ATP-binding protein
VAAEPLMAVRGVSGGYGRGLILQGVDLTVREGQIVAIIGPNGAGKSTLLKAIMGFVATAGGEIAMAGEPITGMRTEERIRRGIAYVAQSGGAFGGLSVADNLLAGGYLIKDRAEVRERIARVYERFPDLASRRKSQASVLSGGERRMLEIGRFLVQSPRLVLLDEPSIGLSPKLASFVYDQVLQLREEGLSFLIVEQNVQLALNVADYVYVLELGRNRHASTPDELADEEELSALFLGAGTGRAPVAHETSKASERHP